MLTLGLLAILGITQLNAIETCANSQESCEIDADGTTVVIVDINVDKVVIKCDGKDKCKAPNQDEPGLQVYSSANETYLICSYESACEGIQVNLGIKPPGVEYSAINYEGTERYVAEVLCMGKQACKSLEINSKGEVNGGVVVKTPDDNNIDPQKTAAFLDGILNCDNSKCVLECGTIQDSCTNAKCFASGDNGECSCNGNCPDGLSNQDTSSPTPAPVPTSSPTPAPEEKEDERITLNCENSIDCVPSNNNDVNCAADINTCNIKCTQENQCQNGVIINALSPNVNIDCTAKNACDKIKVNVEGESNVIITCNDEKVCGNAIIDVKNSLADVQVNINGKEGFFYGKLFCNGKCNLNCMGEKACFSTLYECTNTFDKCSAIGFNNIQNYGDSSCALNALLCEPEVNGDTRVVAPKDVIKLNIDCSQEKSCKKDSNGLKIYTSATETVVNCGPDGCEEIMVFGGSLNDDILPKGFDSDSFGPKVTCNTDPLTNVQTCTEQKMSININCLYDGSCKGIMVNTRGNIDVNINGNGISSLQNGVLICNECNKMDVLCLEKNGCTDAKFQESSNGLITCTNIDGDGDGVINEPTCPSIDVLRKGVNNNNNGIGNGIINENKTKYVLVLGIGLMAMFGCFIFGWLRKKNGSKYNSIKGDGNRSMVKNENIYATYQIELH